MVLHRGTCGNAARADGAWHVLRPALGERLVEGACDGACWAAPAATVQRDGHQHRFARLGDEAPEALLRCIEGSCEDEYAGRGEHGLLGRLGRQDGSFEDALVRGAFAALAQASARGQERAADAVRASGFAARYGPQPVSDPLLLAAEQDSPEAFVDRHLLEGDPFRVVEGILVACIATGVSRARVHLDGQLSPARAAFEDALRQCERHGILDGSALGGPAVTLVVSDLPPEGVPMRLETAAALTTVFDDPPPPTRLVALSGAVPRPGLYEVPVGGATTWTGILAMTGATPGLVPALRLSSGDLVRREEFEELVVPGRLAGGSAVVLASDAEI